MLIIGASIREVCDISICVCAGDYNYNYAGKDEMKTKDSFV